MQLRKQGFAWRPDGRRRDQHWHRPAEPDGDPRDLVGGRVIAFLRVGAQPLERPQLDRLWLETEGCAGRS